MFYLGPRFSARAIRGWTHTSSPQQLPVPPWDPCIDALRTAWKEGISFHHSKGAHKHDSSNENHGNNFCEITIRKYSFYSETLPPCVYNSLLLGCVAYFVTLDLRNRGINNVTTFFYFYYSLQLLLGRLVERSTIPEGCITIFMVEYRILFCYQSSQPSFSS